MSTKYYQTSSLLSSDLSVTAVVVAHNEAKHLKELIPLLLKQEYARLEILVVLDRCTDDSYNLLSSFRDARLKILVQSEVGNVHPKKQAIQAAVELAAGEVLIFTDADCRPVSTKWISKMATKLQDGKDVVIGFSPYRHESSFLNRLIQYETLHTALQYLSFAIQGNAYMAVGRNWAYRKSLFKKVGFGETSTIVGGDDDLLFQRLSKTGNYAIQIDPEAHMESFPPNNWKWWFRQKKRHLSVGKHYKGSFWVYLLAYQGSWMWFYPSVLACLFVNFWGGIIIFMVRMLVFVTIFQILAYRLKYKFSWINYILLDIFYNICYFILALSVLLSKKIQWK